ncbi:phosphonatase-like hydrolase [Chitinophaga arvensicola]|uniref:Phosphonatase-like hydrolase n=1 Tax=Chitinophaga arvensicola TaxID=29529 RepID=A0A1I0S9A8_9BACT|nr:phosphonatase-like hydrolase [Chitinophaga arvensicola]SEW52744.1 phosphonatase-like hydrolase [Chitinophaga arvensicola]
MIKMVVFDMAGTTVNEDNVVYKTLQQAINEQGFSFTLEQVLAEGAGKEKLQAIQSVLAVYAGNNSVELADRIFARFRILLDQAYATLEVTEQENAGSLFQSLRKEGVLVVLNTGYQADTANGLIEKLGWQRGEDYDALITASDVPRNRPYPDMILRAMEQFGISNGREVVKVGDSTIDIEEGKNAGCALSIGITTGAHTKEQLQQASPDYIIHNLNELMPIIIS